MLGKYYEYVVISYHAYYVTLPFLSESEDSELEVWASKIFGVRVKVWSSTRLMTTNFDLARYT